MKILPCNVRGVPHWKLELGGLSGQRKREFYKTQELAQAALEKALKDQHQIGASWALLSATEKVMVMRVLKEIREAGRSLDEVWSTAKEIKPVNPNLCSLRRALDEMLELKRHANCSPRHLGNLDWYLSRFISGRESQSVSSVGEAELNAWFAGSKDSARSRQGYMALLSVFFTHCWRRGYVPENPVRRMQPVHVVRDAPKVLTVEQCIKSLKFIQANRKRFLGWFALTLFGGLRPDAEADYVTWADIDLKRKRIVLTKSKIRNCRPRIIDLNFCPVALRWLSVAKEAKCPLPLSKTTRIRCVRAVRKHLELSRWPQDVLRHTAASNLLAYHQDAGKVAEFLGNSAGTLIRDYKALIFREDAAKFMALRPEVTARKPSKPPAPVAAKNSTPGHKAPGSS